MRERSHRWQGRRFPPAFGPAGRPGRPGGGRFGSPTLVPYNGTVNHPTPDPLTALKAEPPGPDGVRRRLVDRVRELIAEGAYDTPERWAAAEKRMFRQARDGR